MPLSQHELERRELARREFIATVRECALLECELVDLETHGIRGLAPACAAVRGLSWAQVKDLRPAKSSALVYLPESASAAPALSEVEGAELLSMPGVSVADPAHLDWDTLLPPFAAETAGHLSYAHTRLHKSDDFTHSYNPLENHPDWSALESPNYLKSDGAKVVQSQSTGGSGVGPMQRHDPSDMSAVGADYSVEVYVSDAPTPLVALAVALRMTDANNLYILQHYNDGGGHLDIWKRVSGSWTNIGSTTGTASPAALRLEVVGSTLKAYFAGAEKLSISDSSLTAAGYAGLRGFIPANTAAPNGWYVDDFKVYVARTGRMARLISPLAARSQPRFALAA